MKKGKKPSYDELEQQLAEAKAIIEALTDKKQTVQATSNPPSPSSMEKENDISLIEHPDEPQKWMPLPTNFLVIEHFLANISHELRTPLNTILGQTEILQEQIFGSLNDKQIKSVNTIETSGYHLLAIIDNLLDLAQSEAGQLTINPSPLELQDICQASLAVIKPAAMNKQLKIILDFDHSVSTLLADKHRLKQMLVHLLSNAVKFTPQGGQIGLEIVGDTQEKTVTLSVWDTGIGMSEESVRQLFHPFIQLDSNLSRQYEGMGLGLALVCHLTELHGGYISVQSEKGKGSRFTITLPWQEESDWFDIKDQIKTYQFEEKTVRNQVKKQTQKSTMSTYQSALIAIAPLVLLTTNMLTFL
jgi:signal transduction histidine kinase